MTQTSPREVRRRFAALPLAERFHVWARLLSAPLQPIVDAVPKGRFLDLGCGHGLLAAWVAMSRPDVRVVAIDPDARKTRWAAMALQGLPNVDVRTGDAASLLPEFGNGFDGVVLADVLYLLPPPSWPRLLRTVSQLLKPNGLLLLKESEGDGSLRHRKALFQEWVMVRGLGRTHSSGGMTLVNQNEMRRVLQDAGFVVEDVRDLRRGYTTPHILYMARLASPAKVA